VGGGGVGGFRLHKKKPESSRSLRRTFTDFRGGRSKKVEVEIRE